MKEQKFKRGNVVEIVKGSVMWTNHRQFNADGTKVTDRTRSEPEEIEDKSTIGRLIVIEGSYEDLYGRGSGRGSGNYSYAAMYLDTGNREAWFDEYRLRLVDEGGEHMIEQAKIKAKQLEEEQLSMSYIIDNIICGKSFNATSVLKLFEIIGFKSSFEKNGEYFVLYNDLCLLMPILRMVYLAKTEEELELIIDVVAKPYKEGVVRLYNAFKEVTT
jgi:hypothetical protein